MTKETIKVSAKEFCTKHSITAGWSQEQHVGFQFGLIVDMLGIESKEDKEELLTILGQTVNPSAFRQMLENADILAKTEKGAKASILANKYV